MSAAMAAVTTSRRDLLDIVGDPTVRLAVLGASRDPNGKLTVLVLPDTPGPRVVIKVPTTAAGAAAVARERRVLEALHGMGSNVIEMTAPVPLESVTAAGFEAMVLTLLPGTPMSTLYHRWGHTRSAHRVARDLGAVTEWLMRLHSETADGDAPVDMDGGTRAAAHPTFRRRARPCEQSSSVWNAPARRCTHIALRARWCTATSGAATCWCATAG